MPPDTLDLEGSLVVIPPRVFANSKMTTVLLDRHSVIVIPSTPEDSWRLEEDDRAHIALTIFGAIRGAHVAAICMRIKSHFEIFFATLPN